MTATKRKLFLLNGGLGVLLTLAVVLLDHAGHLAAIENWFHRRRALDCQFFIKPPTDKIVFLDIDDPALDTIGRWPWNRNVMADLLEEVAAAKPHLVFLDIIYSEPSPQFEHDQRLADVIKRAGNVLVPISTPEVKLDQESPVQSAATEILTHDLELTPPEVFGKLRARGFDVRDGDDRSISLFLSARRTAMFRRIEKEIATGPLTLAELRPRLIPKTDHLTSPLLRLLMQQHERAEKLQPLRRFTRAPDPNLPSLLRTDEEKENAPLAMFGQHAASSGFVDYMADRDGVVRRIALLELHRGRVLPQVGLVIACKLLGADPNTVSATQDALTIPLPGGSKRVIPLITRPHSNTGKPIGALMEIPFFGRTDWLTTFDPRHQRPLNHVPMNLVHQVIQTRDDILLNNKAIDQAIADCEELAPDKVAQFKTTKLDPADHQIRLQYLGAIFEDIDKFVKDYDQIPPGELSDEDRKQKQALVNTRDAIRPVLFETRRLVDQLQGQRENLAKKFAGKAVLVGSIASGMVRDLKPTPLHDACPGVVIHGLIANAILTGELWRSAPPWVTRLITLLVGLATTAIVLSLPPWKAALSALGFIAAYFVINGVILFDYNNTLVGVAGPVVAMAVTWSSCQLVEILVEKAERARITRRFASYNDPALVDWIVEHPEQVSMTGEEREMTVVFTDLAGFTTLSEQLREKIVPLLNEYLGIMSAIVKKNGGVLNKFLGDGLMFFFNAPKPNPNHAADAARTVLEMLTAVEDFNKTLAARNLPPIAMRAGILTGLMVVGDAGSPDRSDYTVLGDNVNLASRLEGANKATGTSVLMTQRTADLLGDQFVWRPVAKLQVKGKTEHVITCELIAPAHQATPQQKQLAECSKAVFDCFVQGQFTRCLQAVHCLEQTCGPTHLSATYRELSEQYLQTPPTNGFDGSIALTEK